MFLRKSIKVPIYVGRFDIVVMDDRAEYNKIYDDKFPDEKEIFAHTSYTSRKKLSHFVMILNFNSEAKITHGAIAHEALHVTNFILSYVNVEFDPHNEEPFAYLIGWVIDQTYAFLDIHKLVPNLRR